MNGQIKDDQTGILKGFIIPNTELVGIIANAACIKGHLIDICPLKGIITIAQQYEDYEGNYVVTPSFAEQLLPTEEKHLVDDITVKSIPYSEITNPTGGITINIGE